MEINSVLNRCVSSFRYLQRKESVNTVSNTSDQIKMARHVDKMTVVLMESC